MNSRRLSNSFKINSCSNW